MGKRLWTRWKMIPLFIRVIGIMLLVLVAAGLVAEPLLRWGLIRAFHKPPRVRFTLEDVDLHWWRGAIEIERIRLEQYEEDEKPALLLTFREIEVSVEWKALLQGSIVSEVDLLEGKGTVFIRTPKTADRVVEESKDWR